MPIQNGRASCSAQWASGPVTLKATAQVVMGTTTADIVPATIIQNIGTAATTMTTMTTTTTSLTSSANPATVGQTYTYTATVTSSTGGTPTGTIEFFSSGPTLFSGGSAIANCGAVPLINRTARCSVSYSTPGSGQIFALYSGDGNFSSSSSPSINEVVKAGLGATTTTGALLPGGHHSHKKHHKQHHKKNHKKNH
jgi:hypothetical protein